MTDIAIKVQDLSKMYRLGSSSGGTLVSDVNRFISRVRGKEDPTTKIDYVNDRTQRSHNDFVWSLKDINFEIKKGEAVGIIGKNGAGKSTLLKILSRITTPTNGSVKMHGRVASLLEVGTGFHPELTGRENIFMNGSIMGMTRHEIKTKFDEIVDFSGCERYIDTPVKRYSSGMYVRLAFAVAAYLEPEILIVDEVLAVGDSEFQKKCLNKMNQVSKNEGRTVLFVSHNISSIRTLCKKGILLRNGELVGDGSIDSIIDLYEADQQKLAEMNISEFKRHEGNGLLKFTDMKFLDINQKEKTHFFIGETIQIRISFDAVNEFFNCSSSTIDLGISNKFNNNITWMSTSIYNEMLDSQKREVVFQIDKLTLAQGEYNFTLYAANNLGLSDWLKNVSKLTVIYDDYYKTGKDIKDKYITSVTDFIVK